MLTALGNWLVQAPQWIIGLVIFGGLVCAWVAGSALRRRRERGRDGDTEGDKDEQQGMMVSATLGLLALLVGFTFSLAIDRFDARRSNVLNEANAIGTTYLRAQMLEEPHRARISKLLSDYTDTRIVLAGTAPGSEAQKRLLATNDRLIADLWTATVAAFPSIRPYDFSNSFLETMNNLIDMDATRKTGRQAHVPPAVFLALFFYQFTAAAMLGYAIGGRRGRQTAVVLFFLFGLFMMLIIDIDRPTGGRVSESQEPMLQLQSFIRAQPTASFDRLSVPPQAP